MVGSTYLATFRAVASKYPDRTPNDILRDLVASTPGEEGKWFAAEIIGCRENALSRIRKLAEKNSDGGRILATILRPR